MLQYRHATIAQYRLCVHVMIQTLLQNVTCVHVTIQTIHVKTDTVYCLNTDTEGTNEMVYTKEGSLLGLTLTTINPY